MRLHVVSPCIKDENVTQYCRPVWFTDWKEYAVQDRWLCSLVNLFLIIFFLCLTHPCICSVSYFTPLSFHTWTLGGHVDSFPCLGLGTSFGRCCTLYFFFLDLSHGFAWELNWEACRAENKRWSPVHPSVNDFEWMPASSSTGSFESVSLFSRFLVTSCLFVLGGGTGILFFFLKLGIWGWGG